MILLSLLILISPLVNISLTLLISSFSIPFLAAFFIDLMSVSKVLEVTSIKNLSQSTALLPIFGLKNKPKSFGKNTKDALNAGFIWGYDGLINNIINKITNNWKINYKIILTGGYAKLFKKFIRRRTIVDQNITIKGISKVYKELL